MKVFHDGNMTVTLEQLAAFEREQGEGLGIPRFLIELSAGERQKMYAHLMPTSRDNVTLLLNCADYLIQAARVAEIRSCGFFLALERAEEELPKLQLAMGQDPRPVIAAAFGRKWDELEGLFEEAEWWMKNGLSGKALECVTERYSTAKRLLQGWPSPFPTKMLVEAPVTYDSWVGKTFLDIVKCYAPQITHVLKRLLNNRDMELVEVQKWDQYEMTPTQVRAEWEKFYGDMWGPFR